MPFVAEPFPRGSCAARRSPFGVGQRASIHRPRKRLIASRYWAQLLVADAETLLGRQAEDADLALVGVVVDVEGRLADVGAAWPTSSTRVRARKGRWVLPFAISRLASHDSR